MTRLSRSLGMLIAIMIVAFVALALLARRAHGQSTLSRATAAVERVAQARAAKKLTTRYDPTFRKYSKRYFGPAFDWHYFKAQGFAESNLNPNARSWVGARGLMQLMPSTYQAISSRRPEFQSIDDPEWNIAAGIMHDRYLWRLWSDKVPGDELLTFMFASYNAGQGTIQRAMTVAQTKVGSQGWKSVEQVAPTVGRWRYTETLGYVRKIDSTYAWLTGTR